MLALACHPLGARAAVIAYDLADEHPSQRVYNVLGELVSDGLVRIDQSGGPAWINGVIYSLTHLGRAELEALSVANVPS